MSSHNKIIKCMHEMTGLPYSVCRKKLKDNHWDLYYAMGSNLFRKELEKFFENMCNLLMPAIKKLINDFVEGISTAKEAIDEYNRQNNIEALPMEIPGEATGTETGDNLS